MRYDMELVLVLLICLPLIWAGICWIANKHNPFAEITEDKLESKLSIAELADYDAYLQSKHDWATWESLRS